MTTLAPIAKDAMTETTATEIIEMTVATPMTGIIATGEMSVIIVTIVAMTTALATTEDIKKTRLMPRF